MQCGVLPPHKKVGKLLAKVAPICIIDIYVGPLSKDLLWQVVMEMDISTRNLDLLR